ncbi:MAG: hypothetical protein AAF297_00885, partial [Planctomycetota bacterium]
MDFRVISIGALSAHELRNERGGAGDDGAIRSGHATTVLIESIDDEGDPARILVDPGLPAAVLVPRLDERVGIGPGEITHVFLTDFGPERRRALEAFEAAEWLIHSVEREAVGVPLAQGLIRLSENFDEPDGDVERVLRRDIAMLERCRPAPDRLARGVDLFPLPGVTPGCCGLLVSGRQTVLVCGDAVPTVEHLAEGKVRKGAQDIEKAQESFREAIE